MYKIWFLVDTSGKLLASFLVFLHKSNQFLKKFSKILQLRKRPATRPSFVKFLKQPLKNQLDQNRLSFPASQSQPLFLLQKVRPVRFSYAQTKKILKLGIIRHYFSYAMRICITEKEKLTSPQWSMELTATIFTYTSLCVETGPLVRG